MLQWPTPYCSPAGLSPEPELGESGSHQGTIRKGTSSVGAEDKLAQQDALEVKYTTSFSSTAVAHWPKSPAAVLLPHTGGTVCEHDVHVIVTSEIMLMHQIAQRCMWGYAM